MSRRIENVARKIRRILLRFQKQFPKNKWREDLAGSCATSAFLIKDALLKIGLKANIYEGRSRGSKWYHVWTETKDFLIDVTYGQFDTEAPEVLILEKRSERYKTYRKGFTKVTIRNAFSDFSGWLIIQRPHLCINKMVESNLYPSLSISGK